MSLNAVLNWVLAAVEGQALAAPKPEEIKWVETDELWAYGSSKKTAC